jgi:hypothetical protein
MTAVAKDAYLVQIILPTRDNKGTPFTREDFANVSAELSGRFGGATAFIRSPAKGLWEKPHGTAIDDVIVIETMVDAVDEDWWRRYREQLEQRFRQESIVVRSQEIRML